MAAQRSILIVEDEPLIAMMLEDFAQSLGFGVAACCASLGDALERAEHAAFDLAILDVNLKGECVWPVATIVKQRGLPFVLASGGLSEPLPSEFAGAVMLDKPYTIDRVEQVIGQLLTGAAA